MLGVKRRRPTAIDLFSGCGGVTCGLKKAGFKVIGAVEKHPLAAATYILNHPKVHLWEQDIRTVNLAEVMEQLNLRKGELDLLAGCPPCQGFSSLRTLNRGRAVEDDRNDLVFEYARFVLALRPKALMLENVPGLLDDPRLEDLLGTLRGFGYDCRTEVLDAADYGVPQRRRRMLLLAGFRRSIPFAPKDERRITVADAIGWLSEPADSDDAMHNHGETRSKKVRDRIAKIPKNGGSRAAISEQLDCHRRCVGFHDIYGRMRWDDQAPTITTGCINPSKGRFLHPEQDRAITLREAALLQGFPPDYQFSLERGKYLAAELIGNAFPPEFVCRHAAQILPYLSVEG
jgi:DNA (cytosine-5)-methyltransferase 1